VAPFKIKNIQTDNGKEFEKDFKQYIRGQPIKHFFTYPRRPQTNGGVERFNRTIKEQFISWEKEDLVDDINVFNKKLMNVIWYNTKKPHRAINKLTLLTYMNMVIKDSFKSNMLWTLTRI
jgi:transposase InsO family protein